MVHCSLQRKELHISSLVRTASWPQLKAFHKCTCKHQNWTFMQLKQVAQYDESHVNIMQMARFLCVTQLGGKGQASGGNVRLLAMFCWETLHLCGCYLTCTTHLNICQMIYSSLQQWYSLKAVALVCSGNIRCEGGVNEKEGHYMVSCTHSHTALPLSILEVGENWQIPQKNHANMGKICKA